MNQLQVVHHPVSEFVFMEGNQVVTDSLTMAQMFGKEHKNVIRDIEVQLEKLIEANETKWGQLNFEHTQYQHYQNKQWYPKFNLTEDAFAIVAMSYITPEAMKMKIKFLQEFKRMKDYIQVQRQEVPTDPFDQIELLALGTTKLNKRVEQLEQTVNERMTVDYSQQQAIRNAVNRRVYKLWEDGTINQLVHDSKKKMFAAAWKDVKSSFAVNSYCNILQKDFNEAISYINAWRPRLV
ncbi:Rha family transcriptional regulator [Bacillus paramycoides]|uniref:Rha family transcriptional regulator n=1 Tax=Bacillus paramycoides TaxID=2026194 RepID=UPI00382C9227